ncbi:hypothetical protein HGO38_17605 [Rhizobium sp. CG5]|uniref:hypothetical protein n=1 Tax=Rhizobium sp. CG5 TaxID=2726076 RepID=UPI0020347273|nr:hypothetical protein [Rhizobium sp. CG5]MCM2475299.1 hypothetical protein [Rhizobium sp. CG5]
MVSRIGRFGPAALIAVLACTVSLPALAADHRSDYRKHPHRHDGYRTNAGITGSGLPSVLPGIGTYAGSVSAVSFRGVGTYFAIDHSGRRTRSVVLAPKALIIEVDAEKSDAACSYEAGVCVIRP